MNIYKVFRLMGHGRIVAVGNECEGAKECIELRMSMYETPSLPEVEVHMNHDEARWLITMLTIALNQSIGTLHRDYPDKLVERAVCPRCNLYCYADIGKDPLKHHECLATEG